MQRSLFLFFLLLSAVLCSGTEKGNTLVVPRNIEQLPAFKTEEVNRKFRIVTNRYEITAPRLENGILAGERLEHLFEVWRLLFAEFVDGPVIDDVRDQPSLQVILYRNKQEYVLSLFRFDSGIVQTNGYYSAPKKTAYFFSPASKVLLHEGTHQIFTEHFFRDKEPAFCNNYWVVEGIALFMETLKIEEKCYKIGDILDDRLYAAKVYQFERNYNMPIRVLTAMSAEQVLASADEMIKIYSQSAALVHWFMFANKGGYRKHLFETLRRTYLDTAKPETLSELTGLSFEELDKKYLEFLKTIPDEQ